MFKPHYPPHLYVDQQIYFITARTVNQELFFSSQNKKLILYKTIGEAGRKFQSNFYTWSILSNHYHLLFKMARGKDLPDFIQTINGKSAFQLNKIDRVQKRKIWFNYWDHCIRDEVDFWKHFNYIHHQPVKHGLCKTQTEAFQYPFSSAGQWIGKRGLGWIESVFELHPIVDFTVEGD
ncbi:transposase [Candidatus Falkowbacteria bacterium]|nr:transposase [Candidatus Falkowbacteria bacterium]